MTAVLAFDIETIPDLAAIRRVYDLASDIPDAEAAAMATRLYRQKTDRATDFLPPHFHRALVISCVLRREDKIKIFSLTEPEYTEAAAVEMFFKIIRKHKPRLVSWNGGGFDLPVLHYRAIALGVSAPLYWETRSADFRYNNYQSRYHERHLDLMDSLSRYQRGAPLSEVARLCGLPGKMGMDGAQVWPAYQAGKLEEIKRYCECDALNTYLLFLRFQHFRGQLDEERLKEETAFVREHLSSSANAEKWEEFLSEWNGGENAPPLDTEE